MAVARLKAIFQYIIVLSVTGLLVWVSLKAVDPGEGQNTWQYLLNTWQLADKGWLMLMAMVAMISHLWRAERWRMLLVAAGAHSTLYNSFVSLMIGYLVNLVVPRGGEISRCYNLYKLDKSPVEVTFGTVVAERAVDLICFLLLLGLTFLLETEKLFRFIGTLPIHHMAERFSSGNLILLGIALAGLAVAAWWFIRKNEKFRAKVRSTWLGFKSGLMAVFTLRQKNLFTVHSIGIWLLYFLMSYTVIQAFPETARLGWHAVVTLFAIGSVAMVLPLPGGAGSYHTLVPASLVFLYQVNPSEAVAFTFVFHAWQTLIMIAGGVLALVSSYWIIHRKTT
jgi:hypothetical protein